MTNDEIRQALEVVVADLDQAIDAIKHGHPHDPFRARYHTGEYILLNALAAQATALGALSQLETS